MAPEMKTGIPLRENVRGKSIRPHYCSVIIQVFTKPLFGTACHFFNHHHLNNIRVHAWLFM